MARLLRIISGILLAFALYFILLNQEMLLGKAYLVADDFQISILATLIIVHSVLASLERERISQFGALLIPPLVVVVLDILFHTLLFYGFPNYYVLYQSMRLFLAILIASTVFASMTLTSRPIYQSAISATALLIAGISSYYLFSSISDLLGLPSLALPSLIFFIIFAITAFASGFENEFAVWLREERGFLAFMLLVLAGYTIILKPYLTDRPGISNFIEWLTIAIIFLKLSRDLKRKVEVETAEHIMAHKPEDETWKDRIFSDIESAEKAFIETGSKVQLLVALIRYLSSSGIANDEIESLVTPLVHHQDERLPFLALPWEKSMIERRNRSRRSKIVENMKIKLSEV